MATITLKGHPIQTSGELPMKGDTAPDFRLTAADLTDKSLADFQGKKKILNIFPSMDTPVCAISVQKFNSQIAGRKDAIVLAISADLPFAIKRFCSTNGIDNVIGLSMMRDRHFAKNYGVLIQDGPLAGLTARAVVVVDEGGMVIHSELVPEIANEPNYDAAIKALG